MWYLEPSCILLVACMTVEWPLTWACSKSRVRFTGSWAVLRPLVAAGRRPRAVCGSCSLCYSSPQLRTCQVFDLWDQFRPAVEDRQDFVLLGGRQTHGHASDPEIAIALQHLKILRRAAQRHRQRSW